MKGLFPLNFTSFIVYCLIKTHTMETKCSDSIFVKAFCITTNSKSKKLRILIPYFVIFHCIDNISDYIIELRHTVLFLNNRAKGRTSILEARAFTKLSNFWEKHFTNKAVRFILKYRILIAYLIDDSHFRCRCMYAI